MSWLVVKLISWLVHAVIVMTSVAIVSPKNPRNTLGRALVVTLLVAIFVTPFSFLWWLLIPGLIALLAWWAVYRFAYGVGLFGALGAGLIQAILGLVIDWLFGGPTRPPPPHSGAI